MVRAASLVLVSVLMLGVTTNANATLLKFGATLDSSGGSPPNASTATGEVKVWFDTTAHVMRIKSSFDGFATGVTASHIHCCTTLPGVRDSLLTNPPVAVGQNQWPTFPLGATSGVFDGTFDMTLAASWSGGFLAANGGTPLSAETVFLNGLQTERTYYNIHSADWPNGEIGDFLRAVPVPEPASLAIFGVGLAFLGLSRRRRKTVVSSVV